MKFKVTAEAVVYLEKIVEANSAMLAQEKLNKLLEKGKMDEVAAEIENRHVEEIPA
jgi:hypothetical protein